MEVALLLGLAVKARSSRVLEMALLFPSCHVMSCHVMSCHVMSCHVMSCHVMSCHVMSCHVMSCHVMSCHVMLCYVVSCRVMPHCVMSHRVLPWMSLRFTQLTMTPLTRTHFTLIPLIQQPLTLTLLVSCARVVLPSTHSSCFSSAYPRFLLKLQMWGYPVLLFVAAGSSKRFSILCFLCLEPRWSFH